MIIAGLVVLAALGFLVVRGLGNATLYFRTADEAVVQKQQLGDKRFRIEGNVVAGTVREATGTTAFNIESKGVVVTGLVLVSGSIWGRTTWGVWWTWDARLTTTAVLFVLFLGYLALRRVGGDPDARARRNSIAALAACIDLPIVHKSVEWWRTLHQKSSLLDEETFLHPHIHGTMYWTLLLGIGAFLLLFSWLLINRYRLAKLEDRMEDQGLERALAERRAEALTGAP